MGVKFRRAVCGRERRFELDSDLVLLLLLLIL